MTSMHHLPDKGRKGIEEIVEQRKEREYVENGYDSGKEDIKACFPSTSCFKHKRPCPTVSQYHLNALMPKYTTSLLMQD